MSYNFNSVEVWLGLPKSAFVQLKNGIKILLFTVGMGLSSPLYGFNGVDHTNEAQLVAIAESPIESKTLDEHSDIVFQTAQDLFSSLQMHRSEEMSKADIDDFWSAAKEVAWLDFTESMVCYEKEDRQITYDILDKSGLVLHLTQYLDNPKGHVVYSIERNARFLVAGHTLITELGGRLQNEVNRILKGNG